MRRILLCVIACFSLPALAQSRNNAQINYSYTVPVDATNVTLGVKNASGVLIRTIFSGRNHNAGTYAGVWDGNTDSGSVATGGPFTVVVLYGNPLMAWQGEIGNTSESWTGWNRWSSFAVGILASRYVFVNGVGWFTQGFPEGTWSLGWFADSDPNTPHLVNANYINQQVNFVDIATDGSNLYAASNSTFANAITFVTKFDAFTAQPVYFTDPSVSLVTGSNIGAGGGVPNSFPATTLSEIDVGATPPTNQAPSNGPTSIAVQASSNLLAVGHGNWGTGGYPSTINVGNTIKFYDKNTGLTVGSNATLENPISMAFDGSGNLWAVSVHESWTIGGSTATLNMISSPSSGNTITQPITGLSFPLAVDTNQTTGHIYVLDGGSSQQLKEFDGSFNLVRTYGVPGGYNDCNPTVTTNRLMLDYSAIFGAPGLLPVQAGGKPAYPALRAEANGDVWFTHYQTQGARMLHVTPNGSTFNYVSQVIFARQTYFMTTSHTQPSRLFLGFMEYALDYTKQNVPGDPTAPGGSGMWQQVADWAVGRGGACGSTDNIGILYSSTQAQSWLNNIEQLANGHVYANVWSVSQSSVATVGGKTEYMFEVPSSHTAPMRFIGSVSGCPTQCTMDRSGNHLYNTFTSTTGASTNAVNMIPLTGFDGSNNPTYGSVQAAATWTNAVNQPFPSNNWNWLTTTNYEPTTAGVYAYQRWLPYSSTATTNYPHIGGVLANGTVTFLVGPEVCYYGLRSDGAYPCGPGTGNIGPGIITEGHYVLSVNGSQQSVNEPQYNLYYEDGLFIGAFGQSISNSWPQLEMYPNNTASTPGSPGLLNYQYNPAGGWQAAQPQRGGYAQNAGAAKLITTNGNMFFHVMSEANQGPDQFWKISNLSSLHELSGTGPAGSTVVLNHQVF